MTIYRYDALAALALRVMPKRTLRRLRTPPGLRLPGIAIDIWRERPDLQAGFDLATQLGRRRLAVWLVFHGLSETGIFLDTSARSALAAWHQPRPMLPVLTVLPVTWLMHGAAIREGFKTAELRQEIGQQRLLSWYFRVAMGKYNWTALLTDAQAAVLASSDGADGTPRIVRWIWQAEPGLHARFAGPQDAAFRQWLLDHGAARWPVLADPRVALAKPGRPPACSSRPFGVNLIGHARARLGIGEDVRMAAQALASAGVPFTIRDFAAGPDIAAEDDSLGALLTEAMPYRFTMFCTTGMETFRAVNSLGQDALEGQTVIGFWPWELPEFPPMWRHAYALVDEVWASSRYSHDAYARSSPVRLRHLPMAVTVADSDGLVRRDFALPADRYLFVFAYDASSSAARKNPEACLAGFDRAFPRGDERVGLVIKGLRADASAAWRALEARAAADPRLFLLADSLSRGALLDLYRACDCFVSLHRAEGFGRNIAEAMALGRPVIVTAHSGNMDFTRSDTAALVPVQLREVLPGEYPFSAGQLWAEPDVEMAATLMRRMVEEPEWRSRIARAGAQRIAALYAPDVVGQLWAEALRELAEGA